MQTAERPFYIYMHTAPNGKRYVGQTCLEPEKRWSNGNGYVDCTYMHRAIEKYGWDNFKHDILCVVHSKKMADLFEKHYISKYDTFNEEHGYNLTEGGGGVLGYLWSEERKRKRSESIRGEGNGMYGRHHTEESRKKMSERRKGKRLSPEEREFKTNILLEANKRRQTPIRQVDMDGNVVATYDGISVASRTTGYNYSGIANCCLGKANSAYGFRWEYVDEKLRKLANGRVEERKRRKRERTRSGDLTGPTAVIQFDLSGNEIARYASLSGAERKTGLHRDRIGDCCHGGMESYGGFVWKFKNEGQQGFEKTAVIQMEPDGTEVARYGSLAEASEKTGTPRYRIRCCCRGQKKTANGYKWEFVDKALRENKPPARIGVVQLDMDGNEIAHYKSLADAMRATGHDRHRIVECCNGSRESYRQTRWCYDNAA